ncbi:MAG: hypothetical protein GC149_12270 [Gammaproteobacteria bacterium]|nr:hypothetical protein [Gammaproteobacteria bacterium]
MPSATFYIKNIRRSLTSVVSKLPFSKIEGEAILLRSQLNPENSLNEHLVWLWSMLNIERKLLKTLKQEGALLECRCEAKKDEIIIKSNAAEMLHLLEADLYVEVNR